MASIWITYSWLDNSEGNFDYLTQRLFSSGVQATFDRVALAPGQRLWDQIEQRVSAASLAGWAYLVTPNSLSATIGHRSGRDSDRMRCSLAAHKKPREPGETRGAGETAGGEAHRLGVDRPGEESDPQQRTLHPLRQMRPPGR